MERQPLGRVEPGAVLGRTVHDGTGQPLLRAGTPLTPAYLSALRARGVAAVYVRDGLADDVAPVDALSHHVRTTLTRHVATTFSHVSAIAEERGLGDGGVDGAVATLGEQPLQLAPGTVEQLYADVEMLLTELLETDTVAGLEFLKTHHEYTFQHSVDVAVVGVLLGRRLGMPRSRLRELALGCLLHDLGKIYIDRAILDKPGTLTAEEFAVVREHPRLGFELVRRMPVHSILPAHVAYQHHERQEGGGYPRGLVGSNRIGDRTDHEAIGAGQMLLIAEIGAVADVYSAMSSDRPYRAALPPDRVADELDAMAGHHLNREVVEVLHRLVPRYPVGHWVEVVSGRHAGWSGVVVEVPADTVDLPTVRLLLDHRGEELVSPAELDLRRSPGTTLRCLTERPGGRETADVGHRASSDTAEGRGTGRRSPSVRPDAPPLELRVPG